MGFIVDPKTLSFSQSVAQIKSFIDSKSDVDSWRDFFTSGAGQTLIELLAGLHIFDAHQNTTARRETFLQYAENRTSNVGIAQTLGYSVDRGNNAKIQLTITPNITAAFAAYSVIGAVKDKDLIITEDIVLNNGVQKTIDVVIGTIKTENITITSDKLQVFRFITSGVSEDFRILLNSTVVPVSDIILDLNSDKYVAMTNVLGSIDVVYLNDGAYNFTTSDVLTLEFIETLSLTFQSNNLSILYGVIDSDTILNTQILEESKSDIKINAPLFHETQRVVKGRSDYNKIFKQLDANLADTNLHDVSAAVVELTYVKDDLTTFSSAQKTVFLNQLSNFRPFGVKPPGTILEPIQVNVSIDITITLSDTSTSTTTIDANIDEILASYEKAFNKVIDLADVEEIIEQLSYVKIARLSTTALTFNVWQAATQYAFNSNINSSNGSDPMYYKAVIEGTSAATAPTFPTVAGNTVAEGPDTPKLTWMAFSKINTIHQLGWNEFFIFNKNLTLQ